MEKGRKNLFANLLPQAQGANINYGFAPLSDTSLMRISWDSPNDGKGNLINFLFSPEPYTIKIKDNH